MRLPILTPVEYKRKWSELMEENLRLKKHLEQARKDVESENRRFGDAISLRLSYLEDRNLRGDFSKWYEGKLKEYAKLKSKGARH
jgi:ribosomal protein S15P/S13E